MDSKRLKAEGVPKSIVINKMDYLSKLPMEIQQNIIRFLPINDIIALAKTNEVLKNAVNDDLTRIILRQDPKVLLEMAIRENKLDFVTEGGKLDFVKRILSTHDVKKIGDGDRILETPLGLALIEGNLDIVRALVDAGVDIKNADEFGSGLVGLAVLENDLDAVKYFIEKGAVPNRKGPSGGTPLHIAARHGYLDIVKYLVEEAKAKLNGIDEDSKTPLYFASKNGHSDVVKYLVGEGADPEIATFFSDKTPLHVARENGHSDIVEYLESKGVVD